MSYNFDFGTLVKMVEFKKQIQMSSGCKMHSYSNTGLVSGQLKVGDVMTSSWGSDYFYVVVDVRVDKYKKVKGMGVTLKHLGNGKFKVSDGATVFDCGSDYIERKLDIDVTELVDFVTKSVKLQKIVELEKEILQLKKELI